MRPIDYGDEEHELARSAAGILERLSTPTAAETCEVLGELGVLALATPEGGGGLSHIAAVMEHLPTDVAIGTIISSLVAAQLLPAGALRDRVLAGQEIVGLADGDVVAAGVEVTVIVLCAGTVTSRAEPTGTLTGFTTITGERWSRGPLRPIEALEGSPTAAVVADTAVAAHLIACATEALRLAAEHARNRRQFGRSLGSFQAVAHRLAECDAELATARALLRLATGLPLDEAGEAVAACRHVATRAALLTTLGAVQVHGALGFTVEGGIGALATRARQHSLLPRPGGPPPERSGTTSPFQFTPR